MIPLLLSIPIPFTSIQFCRELAYETKAAVQTEVITQEQAKHINERCMDVYSEGR